MIVTNGRLAPHARTVKWSQYGDGSGLAKTPLSEFMRYRSRGWGSGGASPSE